MDAQQATPAASVADPLADSLLVLAAHHGRALSRAALLAGLPISDGKLPVRLYERAAQRAGLEAEVIKRPIADIPALVLPAVLVMRDASTRILMEIDHRKGSAKVLDPSGDGQARTQSVAALNTDYLGYAFLVRPAILADSRAMAAGDVPRSHWFWSVVSLFWSNYSHIAIAAFIVNVLALAYPLFIMSVYDRVIPNGAIPSLVALSIGMLLAITFDFVIRTVRSRIIDMKKRRRVAVGDRVTFVFENHETVLFQIQEMLRAERFTDLDKVRFEVDTYNELIPAEGELSATMLIEITQQERIRPELVRLIGIDKAVSLRIGSRFRIPAVFEPGRSKEDNLSAVQYVRFPFPLEALVAFRDERQEAMIVIDHPYYQAQALFNPEVRRSLAAEV